MIEWRTLSTGARPVPRPFATPLVWFAAFGGALVVVALLNTVVGTDRPEPAVAAVSLLAALLSFGARFTAVPGTTVLCWLILNGFAIPPAGVLTWTGQRDILWLACLGTAAAAGTVTARLIHARVAYRRVGTGVDAEPAPRPDEDLRTG
ncbi:hypothetical protein [Streptomyces lanatus]|uniref:Integral membrane protein n=1 Tax=Streptomyces lanatus TaxID=66900 RepID=A0ABV1Y4H8_9ACTN|nr:hypothetical protein [Streptomyces lanatus]GHH28769.1 hypothetical protein GCM10018780_85830 [Streptomyces lanatus]